jgi:hypothetical protein
MSQFSFIDPTTPAASQGTNVIAGNLNASADRTLEREKLKVQADLTKAELDARMKMQDIELKAREKISQDTLAVEKEGMAQRNTLAQQELDQRKYIADQANSLTKEMEQERFKRSLELQKMLLDATKATDDAAIDELDKLQPLEEEILSYESKMAGLQETFMEADEQRTLNLTKLQEQVSSIAIGKKNITEAAESATAIGIGEGMMQPSLESAPFLQKAAGVIGMAVGAQGAPGTWLGKGQQDAVAGGMAMAGMGPGVNEPTPEEAVSKIGERIAANLTAATDLKVGGSAVQLQARIDGLLKKAVMTAGLLEGGVDTKSEREAMDALVAEMEVARGELGDEVVLGIQRAMANTGTGATPVSSTDARTKSLLRRAGVAMKAATHDFKSSGPLSAEVNLAEMVTFSVQVMDRVNASPEDTILQMQRKFGLNRPMAVDLYNAIPKGQTNPKEVKKAVEEVQKRLLSLNRQQEREAQKATIRAGNKGREVQTKALSSFLE